MSQDFEKLAMSNCINIVTTAALGLGRTDWI